MGEFATLSPAIRETLPNGMRAILLPLPERGTTSVEFFSPLAGAAESAAETGLTQFMWGCMRRGTRRLDNEALTLAIESLGASLNGGADEEWSTVGLSCPPDSLDEALALTADVVQQPAFDPAEAAKERDNTLAAIKRSEDRPGSHASRILYAELYGGHPIGLPRNGLLETVPSLDAGRAAALHAAAVDPGQMLVVCAGRFDADAARATISSLFKARGLARPTAVQPPPPGGPGRTVDIARPCNQAVVVAGFRGPTRLSDDFPAFRLLNAILGEGMSSRLFLRVREELNLAYAAGSSLGAGIAYGHLVASAGTSPATADAARDALLAECERIRKEPPTQEEVDRSRNFIMGRMVMARQTPKGLAGAYGRLEMLGLGWESDAAYAQALKAVTPADVTATAERHLREPLLVMLRPE